MNNRLGNDNWTTFNHKLTGIYKGALNPRPVKLSPAIVLNLCYRQVNISFLDCPEGLYGSKCSQNCSTLREKIPLQNCTSKVNLIKGV